MENRRNSNVELLRIICMLLIIIYHFNLHTDFNDNYELYEQSTFLVHILSLNWGEVAVLLFIMITGYYSVNQKFKFHKLFILYLEIVFYSAIITLFSLWQGIISFDSRHMIEMLFPITSGSYWFITYYFILLLISPLLNILLNNISRSQYYLLISVMIFLTVAIRIIPTTPMISGSYFFSFITVYLISGHYKLNQIDPNTDKKIGLCLFLSSSLFIVLFNYIVVDLYYKKTIIAHDYWLILFIMIAFTAISLFILLSDLSNKGKKLVVISIIFYYISIIATAYIIQWPVMAELRNPNSGFCILAALGIFLIVINVKQRFNRLINWISTSVFSVYLIHDNNCLRDWIWNDIVCAKNILSDSLYHYCFILISCTLIILFVCIIIDKIRYYVIFKPCSNGINNVCNYIDSSIEKIKNEINDTK